MTAFALTPIQPPAVLEAIRDGRPAWLYLPPTIVREWRISPDHEWVLWEPQPPTSFPDALWEQYEHTAPHLIRETTVSPTLPDQPCPECDGKGWTGSRGNPVTGEPKTQRRCSCCVDGRVLLPLLIPGEQCRNTDTAPHWRTACILPADNVSHERRIAGLAVKDRPVPLPVRERHPVNPFDDGYVLVGASGGFVQRWAHGNDGVDITDHFPTPPEPGGVVVDLSGARWLPKAVTHMRSWDKCGRITVPLSPGSGELTILEVPL